MDKSVHLILLEYIIICTIFVITEASWFWIQVLWDVTLCHWMSSSQVSDVYDPLKCWSDSSNNSPSDMASQPQPHHLKSFEFVQLLLAQVSSPCCFC